MPATNHPTVGAPVASMTRSTLFRAVVLMQLASAGAQRTFPLTTTGTSSYWWGRYGYTISCYASTFTAGSGGTTSSPVTISWTRGGASGSGTSYSRPSGTNGRVYSYAPVALTVPSSTVSRSHSAPQHARRHHWQPHRPRIRISSL